jgi:S-formylglutathione hydrolase FrmB
VIVSARIESAALGRNLLGDPSEREVFVFLPPGYDDPAQATRHYPTAYYLHGFGSNAAQTVEPDTERERWVPPFEDVLDPVFGRMGVRPMVVVVPDGSTRYGHGQWVDSPVSGGFDEFVADELVAWVDARYRTLPTAESRGVFGFSSGGIGAWNIGSRHPDTFSALAMLSGDSYFELSHLPFLYHYLDSIWPEAPDGPDEDNFDSRMVYALASCYSPNPEAPPYWVDLPFDFPSGELRREVWDRWLSFDPVVNVHERLDALRRLRGILLDVGRADDFSLHWGHRILSRHLADAGIAHTASENAGSHGGRSRERVQVALEWLSGVLVHEADAPA